MAKKILGIDYGEARTGLAVSDALGFLANGIGNIEERDINRLLNKLAEKAVIRPAVVVPTIRSEGISTRPTS